MSHVETNIESRVNDLDVLERTLAEKFPGMRLIRGKREYSWFGEWIGDYNGANSAVKNGIKPEDFGKCSHCIELEGCEYSIGLVEVPGKDGYCVVYDFWGPGQELKRAIGQGAEKLLTEYARMTAVVTAEQQGMTMVEEVMESGEIAITLTKY